MQNQIQRFIRQEEGQDLAEYGLLVALIAFIVIVGVTAFGVNLQAWWDAVATRITTWNR